MPVIVNELEVVVAPPASPAQTEFAPPPPAPGEPLPLSTFEIAALLERRARQALRVFAH